MKKALVLILFATFVLPISVSHSEEEARVFGSSALKESSVQYLKESVEQQKEIIRLLKEIKKVLEETKNK